MKGKSGEAYSILSQRGSIVKNNHENRAEIAKLSIAIARLAPPERAKTSAAVRAGRLAEALELQAVDAQTKNTLARFMGRCGIPCMATEAGIAPAEDHPGDNGQGEFCMRLSEGNVWVTFESKTRLEENMKRLTSINGAIQLKNAVRQIKKFSDEEETEFATLQRQYLDLLKERDELLHEFMEEEMIAVKTS